MLDFFAVISKGGLVLWFYQDALQEISSSVAAVNALIRNVVLQERGGIDMYTHGNHALKVRMDNQFELLFVVVYQKILQLTYIDKFLSDIHLEFRDKFKNELEQGLYFQSFAFDIEFNQILKIAEADSASAKAPRRPRTFEESAKSKKTIDSMIEKRPNQENNKKSKKKQGKADKKAIKEYNNNNKANSVEEIPYSMTEEPNMDEELNNQHNLEDEVEKENSPPSSGELDEETIRRNRDKLLAMKKLGGGGGPKVNKTKSPKPRDPETKKGKQATVWDMGGTDSKSLDYSDPNQQISNTNLKPTFLPDPKKVGTLKGNIPDMVDTNVEKEKKASGKMFSLFRNLVGGKSLSKSDLEPALEKLKDHLIAKNVAAEIAENLCMSVCNKLEGKHIGTFEGVSSTVKTTMVDSLVQLLTPKRRIDILRDVQEAKNNGRPYSITFCGVNGVGKSTNLAKITFWLIENNYRVLIAACDTFRAGAVEQLRIHMHHLNSLHPPANHGGRTPVQLFEQGYGKDAADIARHAIEYARKNSFDVVLIDTAGRMQDNEPLMRALAKLIHVNEPDMTLFVGEALVGNEAVDQLVKFNRALANQSSMNSDRTQIIDGIVLTKFDTIDDKVGAAISMTYITGQPIIFVGTGQTYTDLRNLDAHAVVNALMK